MLILAQGAEPLLTYINLGLVISNRLADNPHVSLTMTGKAE
mgnify:CR=1 FL=1|jgi:hypothetical protein|nr:hypothetical protein RKHAN_00847 [Rhizobium sp. Khangiran2]